MFYVSYDKLFRILGFNILAIHSLHSKKFVVINVPSCQCFYLKAASRILNYLIGAEFAY